MSRTSSQGSGSFKEDEARIAGIVRAAERAHRRAASARAREVQALINFVAAKAGVPRPVRRATAPAAAAGNGSGKPKPAAAQRVPTRPQPAAQTPRAPQRAWSVDTLPPPETGAYEIVHELSHCGASVVYAARQAGGSDGSAAPKFAVKVTRPPGIWSADEARRHVHDFLAAAALQKRVADARPDPKGHWAPIHGEPTEIRGDGAWYATDRFDRSAEDLASLQRGSIAEGDLWRLVSGVIDGLEQLEQVAQRPHGNLKPGNVLVASRGRRFRAVLADPLADDESARHLGRAADLRQLGDLIRKLVLRDAGGTDAATASLLGAPTAWAHLGQFANQWREFCGALLEGGARYPTFDDLRAALRPLSPKVRVGKQMAVAAGAVLLVTGISVGVHLYNHRYQPAQWEALCDHWDWYHRAHDALKSDRGTLALDGPVESEPLSPWQIAGDDYKTSSMDDLRRLGRENTPKTLFRGKEDIRTSLRAVDALHERLLPKHWRFWAEVDGRIAGIEKAEPKFAEELRSYRQAVVHSIENEEASSPAPATAPQGQPAADRQLVWTQFDDLLRLGTPTRDQQGVAKPSVLARIETVNAQCDEIRKAATWKDGALEVTDAFLATVVRDIRADVNQRPVHRLGSADADAYELVTGTVLKDLHAAANGFYWKGIRDDEGHVDAEHLKQLTAYVPADAQYGQVVQDWVAHVGAYQVLVAIPRPDEWKQKHAPDKLIERLDAAEKGGAVDGDDELKGRIARLRDNIGRLRTLKEEIENHVYVKRESKLMVDRLAEIDKLQRDVEATLAKVVEDASVPLEWLANITKAQGPLNKALQPDRGFASPAVAEFWRQEKDRFVRELPAKHARSDEAKLFANVQLRLTRAARRLDENELPLPSADPAAPEWAKPFFAFAPERRGQLLKGLCDKVLADPRPMVDASDELIQQARRDWTDWQKAIADWVKVGTHLQDALAPAGGLYFVDDTPPGEPAPLGRQLEDWLNLAASDKDPLHLKASTACAKELAILRSSLERLKSLAAKDPAPAEVRGALTNPSAPAPERWAAWRAAGRLHGAQRLPLKDPAATQPSELTARNEALKLVNDVRDELRRKDLHKVVVDEDVERWMSRAKPAATTTDEHAAAESADYASVLDALNSRDDFEVREELQKDPRAQYNLALCRLIKSAPSMSATDGAAADADAMRVWADFRKETQPIQLTGNATAGRDDLLRKLGKAEEQNRRAATHTPERPILEKYGWTSGPPNAGAGAEQEELTFKWAADPEHAPVLRFRRVQLASGEWQFVLRNTVTIEQFNFVLAKVGGPDFDKVESSGPVTRLNFGPWFGIDKNKGTLQVRSSWIGTPAELPPKIDPIHFGRADLTSPSGKLPTVSVAVDFMEAYARKMGAHLTTLSEWQAARDEERGGKALWNLRDATWKAADDYFIRNIKGTSGADGLNPRGWQRFRSDDEDPGSVWDAKFRPASQTTYDDGAVLPIAAEPDPETERSGLRGRKFFHVIGNVWQAVEVDAANPAAKLPGETKYAVVGGSAISAPELGSELPLRLTKSELEGATDIGFRISFKAPLQPPRVLLTEAIHSAGKFLHD